MGKFNLKNKDDFDQIRKDAENFYERINNIKCPYFKEKIAFNAKGLRHLKFKTDQQARPQIDQYPRLKLLPFVPQVLKNSHTLQGIWQTKRFEQQKTNGKWKKILKDVTFYEFIAVLDNIRLKIIIKNVAGGEKSFWSVIPYWKIDKKNGKRILHGSSMEENIN